MITCVTHSQTETLSIYMSLNTFLDIYMSIIHVLRRIPIKKKLDVLTLHTPYIGALVSGGAPLLDPRLWMILLKNFVVLGTTCLWRFDQISERYSHGWALRNASIKKTRAKNGGNGFLWQVAPVGQARAQIIDKLDEACTNGDDRMMLVQHSSGDRVMS